MSDHHGPTPEHQPFDHEIETSPILKSGVFLVVLTAVSMLIVTWLLAWFDRQEKANHPPTSVWQPQIDAWEPPGPQLQEFPPTVDIQGLRAIENERLHSYRWVDQKQGVVQIPIEKAIELFAERGLPSSAELGQPDQRLLDAVAEPAPATGTAPSPATDQGAAHP